MDDEVRGPIRATRWLAWATAGLLLAGGVSAGVVHARDDAADQRIAAAAGDTTSGLDVPTTVSPFVAPELPPVPPVPETTTTVAPKAATTTTTKTPARPTTTTTKAAPATTTTVAVASGVVLTVVNQYPGGVILTVNGTVFNLAQGQTAGPVAITRYSHGNDIVEIKLAADPSCGSGDADGYFPTPGSYRMTVVAGPSPVCQGGVVGPSVQTAHL